MPAEQVEHHHQTDAVPGVICIEYGGDSREERRFQQHQPWCIMYIIYEEDGHQTQKKCKNDVMAILVDQHLPQNLSGNGRHQQCRHVFPDVPGMMISLYDEKGKDGKNKTSNASHDFISPDVAHPQLLVKDVIGDMSDSHGDHEDYLQRTTAEKLFLASMFISPGSYRCRIR